MIKRAINSLMWRIFKKMYGNRLRMYAAAKQGRLYGNWMPADIDVNTIIRQSSPILRARIRQLVRDFPYFNRAINILVNYTVGTGIRFQSKVVDENGEYNKKVITQIEDAIEWAMEELDASGRMHGYELERLAKRQEIETGEFLFIKVLLNDKKRYIPYALLPVEPDWLTDVGAKPEGDNVVDQGIEYEPKTGKVVAYHFAIPSDIFPTMPAYSNKTQRITAENVIHGYQMLRPGQLRGVSPFVSAVLIAHDLEDYIGAEIDATKLAARYLAFVRTPDIGGFQSLRATEEDNKKIEEIENAIIEYLRPGEDITIVNPGRPTSNFDNFCKFVLRMVAVATDVTYELLTTDYDAISYSNLRGIRNDFEAMIKPHQQRHIWQYSQKVVRDIIYYAALSGRLNLPGFFQNPRKYYRGVFIPPGMESIDPLREGRAWIDQIRAGLRSPQEIAASRGRDFEEIINEIAEAKRMMEQKGLDWNGMFDIKTALTTNPAKLAGSETEQIKREEIILGGGNGDKG